MRRPGTETGLFRTTFLPGITLAGAGLLFAWALSERWAPARPAPHRRETVNSSLADEDVRSSEPVPVAGGPPVVVRLLGERSIDGPAKTLSTRTAEIWLLLGLLAEHRTTLLTRATAEERLWQNEGPARDRFPNLLREARSKLCDALGVPSAQGRQVIEFVRGTGYRLNTAIVTCDVWRFRDAVALADRVPDEEPVALRSAASTYAGDYLDGIAHSWAVRTRLCLRREAVLTLSRLADLEDGPLPRLTHLERATSIDRVAEHLYQRRMEIYAELGWTQEVHYCFQEISEELKKLGRRPSARTNELGRQLADTR